MMLRYRSMQLKQPRWFKLFFTGLVHHLIRVALLGCSLTHFTERNPGVLHWSLCCRGDGGVAGEGTIVGVPKFHSWGKCTMPLMNINLDWMSNTSSGLCIIYTRDTHCADLAPQTSVFAVCLVFPKLRSYVPNPCVLGTRPVLPCCFCKLKLYYTVTSWGGVLYFTSWGVLVYRKTSGRLVYCL